MAPPTNADPTLATLAELDDRSKYNLKLGVPLFRPHVAEGGRDVTDETLERIAANTWERQRRSGMLLRLIDGHIRTDPNFDESKQGKLLGFGANVRMGRFGPEQVAAILYDEYTFVDDFGTVKQRPYRSAEIYWPDETLRGVGLIIRDPRLDMGTITYVQTNAISLYSSEPMEPTATPKPTDQPPPEETFTPEEINQYTRCGKYFKKMKTFALYAEAGPGAPSATDVVPPDDKKPKPDDLGKNASPELLAVYARLEASEGRVQNLLMSEQRRGVEATVKELGLYFQLDPAAEIDALLAKTQAERTAHVELIKKFYRPIDQQIDTYSGPIGPGGPATPTTSETQMKRAVTLAGKKGISYDAALALIRANSRES